MTVEPNADIARARATRIFWIAVITVVVEVGLFITARAGPALAGLIRPVYVVVAVTAALTIWHAAKRRIGHDRRHTDRRHGR